MERTVRRSGLPYAKSQGFNVHMRHAFSSALPVATASLDEYMDVDMDAYVPAEAALTQLKSVAINDLPVIGVEYIGKDAESLQVSHCVASYQIELLFKNQGSSKFLLEKLINTSELQIIKKKKVKVYKLSEYLCQTPTIKQAQDNNLRASLTMVLQANPSGSLRPSAVLTAIASQEHAFEIISITRTSLKEVSS
jgi:radical SAM-linked protein